VIVAAGSNGSFGLWGPGGGDAWLDAYVTDFLTRARERNFAVPEPRSVWRSTTCAIWAQSDPTKDVNSDLPYVYYVLARNGAAPLGDLRYLADLPSSTR